MPKMYLGREAEVLRALVQEAHGVLKDLRAAIREGREVAPAIVEQHLDGAVKAGLEDYAATIETAMDAAVARVNGEFDKLADLLLGRDAESRREGRADIPSLVERMAGAEADVPAEEVADPRVLGGSISASSNPHAMHAITVDARGAVLLDRVDVSIAHGVRGTSDAAALLLAGRVNGSRDRARVLYLLDSDGAAAIVTEIEALMDRAAPMGWRDRYEAAKARRLAEMPQPRDGASS